MNQNTIGVWDDGYSGTLISQYILMMERRDATLNLIIITGLPTIYKNHAQRYRNAS